MFDDLFNRAFGPNGNMFGHPTNLEKMLQMLRGEEMKEPDYSELEEEVFEVVKGDYKTTIVCKFNKKGYLVSHSAQTRMVVDDVMKNLKEKLTNALQEENYEEAARIQKMINEKRMGDEKKPTL